MEKAKYIIGIVTITTLLAWLGNNLLTFGIVCGVIVLFLAKCWQSGKTMSKKGG